MANVYPDRWSVWFTQQMVRKNIMMAQGLVEEITSSPVTQSGEFFKKPYRTSLDNAGAAERLTPTTTLTPVSFGDLEEYVVVVHRSKAFYDVTLNDILRGIDSNAVVAQQLSNYWAQQIQDIMNAMITGVFNVAGFAANHENDVTGTASPNISMVNIINTQHLLGELSDSYKVIVMHSNMYKDLKIQDMIDFVDAGTFGERLILTGTIPTILKMRIVVNDTLCAKVSDKYPVYLMTERNFKLYWQRPLRMDEDKDILTGGGKNILATHIDMAPHIDGMSFDVASITNPTDAQFEAGANWTQIDEDKNIPLVRMLVEEVS